MSGRNVVTRTNMEEKRQVIEALKEKYEKETKVFVGMLNEHEENYISDQIFAKRIIPLNCVIDSFVSIVRGMTVPQAELKINVEEDSITNTYGLVVKEGVNHYEQKISLPRGCRISMYLTGSGEFTLKELYIGAIIKGK